MLLGNKLLWAANVNLVHMHDRTPHVLETKYSSTAQHLPGIYKALRSAGGIRPPLRSL